MALVREKATCTGCEACAAVCPVGCIEMARDEEGFAYPNIQEEACRHCGLCHRICPVGRVGARPRQRAYAARALSDHLRERSSSGGVFSLLADRTLGLGGEVFGAAFDAEGRVGHRGVSSPEDLSALRGSKYVQSSGLAGCFHGVRAALRGGRPVLFSGTPCQVAGLYAALGKRYEPQLATVDLVCHGVPSPMVYEAYRQALEAERGVKIASLSFRDKSRGWKDFGMRVTFTDGTEYLSDQRTDPFLVAFLRNLCLRPSCHGCPFAGDKRQAQLTLADCWGAGKVTPELDDDRGLSLVLVGDEHGASLWSGLQEQVLAREVDVEPLLRDNPCIEKPVPPHPRRAAFFRHVRRQGMAGAEKYSQPPGGLRALYIRFKNRVKRLFPSGNWPWEQ